MKCIMCKTSIYNGVIIMGNKNNYKVCRDCLEKYYPVNIYDAKDKTANTKYRAKLLQEDVDNKLNKYLL